MNRSLVALSLVWTGHAVPAEQPRAHLTGSHAIVSADTVANDVVERMVVEGMDSSQVYPLAQVLFDSIGPRLTGTPAFAGAAQWLTSVYRGWGIPARNEPYGTWNGWRRGTAHIDLMMPRVRTLEGDLLAWSPGTVGADVTGPVIVLPNVSDSAAFAAWLPQAKGKYVLLSVAEPTCRPDDEWMQMAAPGSFERMDGERARARVAWTQRVRRTGFAVGLGGGTLGRRLGEAGAAGVITSRWPNAWGARQVMGDIGQVVPALSLSCEDYGLLFRLAEQGQGPMLRLRADAEALPPQPATNVIAELRGVVKPNEYVLLSAHLDSWDGASGTIDNGTGTIMMLEAMRILKKHYRTPRRTILVGHWGGEEQGLFGSAAFVEDHPDVVRGLQVSFNQDVGTGRIARMYAAGYEAARANLQRWISDAPARVHGPIDVLFPDPRTSDGTDHASFDCAGAPGFDLVGVGWDYSPYTHHTNRDTFDKIVFDDLRANATLVALLAYFASEDPDFLPELAHPGQSRGIGAGRAGIAPRGTARAPVDPFPACAKAMRRPLPTSR